MSSADYSGLSKTKGMSPVLHIRLNPEDVMGCIDVIKASGVNPAGMSLAMIARLALSAFLEGARQNETIPTRDGYEYSEMVAPYLGTPQSKKLQIFSTIRNTEIARVKVDEPASQFAISSTYTKPDGRDVSDEVVRRRGRLMVQIVELETRMNADPANFSPEQNAALTKLREQLDELS